MLLALRMNKGEIWERSLIVQNFRNNIIQVYNFASLTPLLSAAISSAMQGYGYSDINNYLDIQFTSGAVYRYSDVPEGTFNGLLGASSQGGYFNEAVRNVYFFERLE